MSGPAWNGVHAAICRLRASVTESTMMPAGSPASLVKEFDPDRIKECQRDLTGVH